VSKYDKREQAKNSCSSHTRRPRYLLISPWLKENYGCEVIALIGDVGNKKTSKAARKKKAVAKGASSAHVKS